MSEQSKRGSQDGGRDGRRGGGGRAGGGAGGGRGQQSKAGGSKQRRGGRPQNTENDKVTQLAGPLERVLKRLPETQRRVLELRMGLTDGHPHDLADTARELGLSMSEAREIEKRAFEHIREAVPLQQLQRFLPK
ncbi:MAG TPA: sigma factor-like helix-turn-helix DNA-binding protein [Egicoccus sp.]|nr:sigma factor-like helix-turn-helix DNA-binding protein [Egicoccus sp.]HSK24177.1 sigma factor-like helix-turn-helix DNA-binding protein [Egicoccus sp.]